MLHRPFKCMAIEEYFMLSLYFIFFLTFVNILGFWLMISLSPTKTPMSFSAELLSSRSVPAFAGT